MGEVALAAVESRHDMGALQPSPEAISTSGGGDPSPHYVANPLFEEPDAVVPHVRIYGSPGRATAQGDPTHVHVENTHANKSRCNEAALEPNRRTEPLVTVPQLLKRSDENNVSTRDRLARTGADARIKESAAMGEVRLALRPYGRQLKLLFRQ